MNKFLRFSFWLIFLIAAGILALAFIEPNDVFVTRSIVVNAPKEAVFEQIVKFKNWNNWGILHQKDTGVKITYTGDDGQAGSSYHWTGDEHITGEGEMKNEGVEGTTMHYSFSVIKPGEMLADGTISAADTAGLTKVTWTFHKHFPFLANAVLVVFNLDKYIGGDFELALGNLKQFMEQNTLPVPQVAIKEVAYPGHIYAGVRQAMDMSAVHDFLMSNCATLSKIPGLKINGRPVGIYYAWDTASKRVDIMVAFPVADSSVKLMEGAYYLYLAPSKAYMAVHKGGYAALPGLHQAIDKYMAAKGKTEALNIEEYPTGPMQEPDSNKWITNVYYLVR